MKPSDWYKDKNGVTRFDKNVKTQSDVDKISPGGKYIASQFNTKTANYYSDGAAFFKNEHEGYKFMIDNSNMQKGENIEVEHVGFITNQGVAVLPKEGKMNWWSASSKMPFDPLDFSSNKDNLNFKNYGLHSEMDVKGYERSGYGKGLTVNFQGKTIKPIAWIHTHPDSWGGFSQSQGDTGTTRVLGIPSIVIGRSEIYFQTVKDAENKTTGGAVMTRMQLETGKIPLIYNINLNK